MLLLFEEDDGSGTSPGMETDRDGCCTIFGRKVPARQTDPTINAQIQKECDVAVCHTARWSAETSS